MSKSRIKALILSVLMCWSAMSMAAVEGHYGKIKSLLADTELFGHCMLLTDITTTLDCPELWISLDCKGSFGSKENTRRLWDLAQLAYAMDKGIYVVVNDQEKHNGYCSAERLEIGS